MIRVSLAFAVFLVVRAECFVEDLSGNPAEAKERLARLFDHIDTSQDGKLDENELMAWIDSAFVRADRKAAAEMLAQLDLNGDGFVSLEEYIGDTYGYSLKEIEGLRSDESTDAQQFLESVDEEKEKFSLADLNGDGVLNTDELAAFNAPYHYPHMVPFVVGEILRYQDQNGDKRLSWEEYIANNKDSDTLKFEETKFKSIDKNGDQVIDQDELKIHYKEESEKYARLEANHLLVESDLNADGKLTRGEVSEAFAVWLASPATDRGELLSDDNLAMPLPRHKLRDEL
ncbi:unnamed protein product [Mesocestoides corti]|uniref:EF-hand domain-containing protein n=2 Tax=Mesocestoides corti TaxID=53468 RepID=A0A0R3U883_MESCO|nr:unnamed protein product [Mesocestoides corti]